MMIPCMLMRVLNPVGVTTCIPGWISSVRKIMASEPAKPITRMPVMVYWMPMTLWFWSKPK